MKTTNRFIMRLPKEIVRLCKLHSVKYDMCPRVDGSTAHFVKWAIIKELKKYVPYEYVVKAFNE